MGHRVAVVVGSLRKEAFSLKIADALTRLAPSSLQLEIVTLHGLSLYNQDLETGTPPADWTAFRQKIKAADAVLFVTPEYNRTVPGVLKNAIDVGSRPYGQAVFNGKPGAVIASSPGALGGFGAYHNVRQALSFFTMPLMSQPEAYLGGIGDAFDDKGELKKDGLRELLTKYLAAFADFVAQQKT